MNKSEQIGKLALALSKLQGEVQNVYKDKKGYGYKYTELSSILEVTRPLCAKHELAVTQLCGSDDSGVSVETVLLHSSGEWISKTFALPILTSKTMSAVQGAGSSITYARRYALAALLGIAQTDDDGSLHVEKEEVTTAPKAEKKTHNITASLEESLSKGLTPLERLTQLIETHKLHEKKPSWLEFYKVKTLEEISEKEVVRLIKTIEEKI